MGLGVREGDPIELYACLDISNPMIEWEVAIGRISSGVERSPDGFGISARMHSLLRLAAANGIDQRLLNEFKLERVRQQVAPNAVSRLDGLYFFRSYDEALRGLDRFGWHHKVDLLARVLFWPTAVTEVDSEWITSHLREPDEDWMPGYWSGVPAGGEPLIEVLAQGVGLIDNTELRRRAYEGAVKRYPLFSKVLSFGAAAFWCGHDTVAQAKPGVLLTDGGITASAYIYMKDFEAGSALDMEKVIDQCISDGAVFPYDPRCDESDDLVLPDFTELTATITDPEFRRLAGEVHDGMQ